LIVAQVAVSFMLLIGAGLMLRSLDRLQHVDPGFDPERVMTMRIALNWSKYTGAPDQRAFFNELLRKVQAMPGVVSAAASFTFPLNQSFPATRRFQIEGQPVPDGQPKPAASFRVASADYFKTLRIPVVKGRVFTEADDDKAPPVVVINQTMARHRWGEKDPVGSRVTFDGQKWTTIVGVVGDVRQEGLDIEPGEEIFLPFPQNASVNVIVVRTATDPTAMARQFRDVVYSIDPEQPVTHIRTLEEVRRGSMATPRLTTILLGLFAALALTITAAGLAGVISFSVSQRTHEIGIRLALGAGPRAVLSMIMRQGMGLIVTGVGLGVAGAYALGRIMSGLLFEVGPHDPPTYVGVAAILLAVAAAACFVPARRATGIDPLGALRTE
jgi:predicted permease